MLMSKVKLGMRVRIKDDISTTHKRFRSCSEMHKMKGRIYQITSFPSANRSVSINGYTWDIDDIEEIKAPKIKSKIIHFDTSELTL